MADTGLKYASSVSDVAGVGTITWQNPSNAVGNNTNDGTSASVSASGINHTTHFLNGVINFGLTGSDTIVGIANVAFRRFSSDDDGDGPMYDYVIKLSKNGTVSGNDKSVSTNWPVGSGGWSPDLGGSLDTWGLSLNGSDTIGIAVSGVFPGSHDVANITAFRARAYYSTSSGLILRTAILTGVSMRPVGILTGCAL